MKKDWSGFVAHTSEDQTKKQYLLEHLFAVAEISSFLGEKVKLERSCILIALLHDFGKSSEAYSEYVNGKTKSRVNHSSAGGRAIEYLAEQVLLKYSKEINIKIQNKIDVLDRYREMLIYPILAHHGLFDVISNKGNNIYYKMGRRLNEGKPQDTWLSEDELDFLAYLNEEYKHVHGKDLVTIYYEGLLEYIEVDDKIELLASKTPTENNFYAITNARDFYHGALVRLLLSILKEGDIYDSSNCFREEGEKDKLLTSEELIQVFGKMKTSVDDAYQKFAVPQTKLDEQRTFLADQVLEKSNKYSSGNYKLSMNVGAGKTNAALRYAVYNASEFQKSRIFYCTAFLSVLEQNAKDIQEIIGSEYVLEHHSNILQNNEPEERGDKQEENDENAQDKKEYSMTEYLKESWESPVILTTLVQLYNSLFKGKANNLRRFSKLIDAVIIIDEIQSLPSKAVYVSNLMLNFLAEIMNAHIVHSTATQPNYGNEIAIEYPCVYGKEGKDEDIISMDKIDTKIFRRVDYYSLLGDDFEKEMSRESIVHHIKDQLETESSALVIMNTKASVKQLYDSLEGDEDLKDCEVIYLTTNMCAAHRLDIIREMKSELKKIRDGERTKKIICVSTKLIEAGVNIDFDVVYRALAGMDSIIQAAGRCNRENRKATKGKVFIFQYKGETLSYLKEIQEQAEAAKIVLKLEIEILSEDGKIDIESLVDYYFHQLFIEQSQNERSLEYIIKKGGKMEGTILELLSTNQDNKSAYYLNSNRDELSLAQSFDTAAKVFNLIDEDAISIIVPYQSAGDKRNRVEELQHALDSKNYSEMKDLLQQLQKNTISIRRTNMDKYFNFLFIENENKIFILLPEYYDNKVGLMVTEELRPLVI